MLGCHYVTEDNLILNFYICDFIWLQLSIQMCIQVAFSEKGRAIELKRCTICLFNFEPFIMLLGMHRFSDCFALN